MNIKKETVEWIQAWLIFLSGAVVGYLWAPAHENCHNTQRAANMTTQGRL